MFALAFSDGAAAAVGYCEGDSNQANPGLAGAGTGYELQSIAAAVIGGVLLTGGVSPMLGPLAGVILPAVIENVINQVGARVLQCRASLIWLL